MRLGPHDVAGGYLQGISRARSLGQGIASPFHNGRPELTRGGRPALFPKAQALHYNPGTMITLRDRYRGTLLGLAVGNTLGLPVESWPSGEIRGDIPREFARSILWS
jgi:hypothetical protein